MAILGFIPSTAEALESLSVLATEQLTLVRGAIKGPLDRVGIFAQDVAAGTIAIFIQGFSNAEPTPDAMQEEMFRRQAACNPMYPRGAIPQNTDEDDLN